MADKVLIVEDEEVVRELLEGWLEDAGYETLASPDGLDGLRKLYSFRPARGGRRPYAEHGRLRAVPVGPRGL